MECPRSPVLRSLYGCRNMSLRRGEHAGRLKQVLSSKQLALGTSIGGTLLGGADEFRYRLAVDDQWMDVIMHRCPCMRLDLPLFLTCALTVVQSVSGLVGLLETCGVLPGRLLGAHRRRIRELPPSEDVHTETGTAARGARCVGRSPPALWTAGRVDRPCCVGVFQLDGRSCSRLIEGPLMDLHTDFMNDYAAMIAAVSPILHCTVV